MYNIILVCEHGASTSAMVTKMRAAAEQLGEDCEINAYSYSKMDELIDSADIVLLGPQVRFKKKTFEQKYADKNVEFVLIDPVDFGTMNGEKVVKMALEHLKQ
jgi:PTS system cellobiose-specific IIB component